MQVFSLTIAFSFEWIGLLFFPIHRHCVSRWASNFVETVLEMFCLLQKKKKWQQMLAAVVPYVTVRPKSKPFWVGWRSLSANKSNYWFAWPQDPWIKHKVGPRIAHPMLPHSLHYGLHYASALHTIVLSGWDAASITLLWSLNSQRTCSRLWIIQCPILFVCAYVD